MFLVIIISFLSIHKWGECSPFPNSMLHTTDESYLLQKLHQNGYSTPSIPASMQVSTNFSLHSLMPQPCNLSRIDSYTISSQYGLVGFQSKTYTEEYFPQGKYYHSIEEYDSHCTCPYTRTFTCVMALGHYMCHQFGKSTKSKGSSPAESTYQTDAR